MSSAAPDPYRTLGIDPDVSEEGLRAAYRRLVMLHHPDHNGGSAESAVRFAEIQEAYAHVRLARRTEARPADGAPDPALEARIAEMERELATARTQREQAARRAQRLARLRRSAPRSPARPSDEELGYVSTNDSFTKILDDFADHVAGQASDAPRRRTRPRSVTDWIDELGGKLTGEDR